MFSGVVLSGECLTFTSGRGLSGDLDLTFVKSGDLDLTSGDNDLTSGLMLVISVMTGFLSVRLS